MYKGDLKLIAALVQGQTVVEASSAAGVAERTAYRRLRDPEFQAELRCARAEFLTGVLAILTDSAGKASQALVRLLDSADEKVCLAAAEMLLEKFLDARQHQNFEDRVELIEAAFGIGRELQVTGTPGPARRSIAG